MKCKKCGSELKSKNKYCSNCGEAISNENDNKEEAVKTEEIEEKRIISGMRNDTFFCILSLLLFFAAPTIRILLDSLANASNNSISLLNIFNLSPLAAYGLAIYARVKYPNSKFAKVLLIIYIVLFAIVLIIAIILLISCISALRSCSGVTG